MSRATLTRALLEALGHARASPADEAEKLLLRELPRAGRLFEGRLKPKVRHVAPDLEM